MNLVKFVPCLLLTGCATMSGYQPTVDTKLSDTGNVSVDLKECQVLAKGGIAPLLSAGAIGGGLGAGMGATMGAVVGGLSVAPMAMGGAAALGVPVIGYEMFRQNDEYMIGYRSCMRNRGYYIVR